MQQTNLNVAPFYDDYDPSKGFHRVLFKPRPVQTRELNQLQSILQEQVNRIGDGIYQDGSVVTPGGISILNQQVSVGLTLQAGSSWTDITSTTQQLFLVSNLTSLQAQIQKTIAASGADNACFFLEYLNSGSVGQDTAFSVGDVLSVVYYNDSNLPVTVANVTLTSVGQGIWVKVAEGVYYIRGFFVETPDQDYVLSKFTNTGSARVGFQVLESIVDETTDTSLFSNATGQPNFKAPGAARLQFTLSLTSTSLTDTIVPNFVELARIVDGDVQTKIDTSTYSVLGDALAQRTYEEAGNFTVDAFTTEIHDNTADTTGATFIANVKPGIAYVNGYRIQNAGIVPVTVSKARDTNTIYNTVASASYGPYLYCATLASLPKLDITIRYQMQDSTQAIIGTCAIRSVRGDGTGYRIYPFDMIFNAGKTLANLSRIYYSDASNLFVATPTSAVMFDGSKDCLVFPLPVSSIKTLKPAGLSATSYTVYRSFDITTDASGNASINGNVNEIFSSWNSYEWLVALSGAGNAGTQITVQNVTFSGTPVGRTASLTLGIANANKTVRIVAPVIKTTPSEKTKTLTTATETYVMAGVATQTLKQCDALKIVSIIETLPNNGGTQDVTSLFNLDNGQRDDWYQLASIKTISGTTVTKNITIVYQYFAHSSGDFFSIDSYGGIDRSLIPNYAKSDNSVTYSLADSLDFRPFRDVSTNTFTTASVNGEILRPGDNIRANCVYYQPRVDSLYVDANGNFAAAKGIPADAPTAAPIPDNAMLLYTLSIPAYTLNVSAITATFVDNRRYTMQDIGSIDSRVTNLEAQALLTQLQLNTAKIQVQDSVTGNNRFKNGFAVDGFTDFSLADTSNTAYAAAMDQTKGELKPGYKQFVTDFKLSTIANAVANAHSYTLPYTSVVALDQSLASHTLKVNSFSSFSWVGTMKLEAQSDAALDIGHAPYGRTAAYSTTYLDANGNTQSYPVGYFDTFYYSQVNSVNAALTASSGSPYFQWGLWNTADWYNSATYMPYMRSRQISFEAHNLKPNTRMYSFLNGIDVNAYTATTGNTVGTSMVTDANGTLTGFFAIPDTLAAHFNAGAAVFRLVDNTSNNETLATTAAEANYFAGYSFKQHKDVLTPGNTRKNMSAFTSISELKNRTPIAQTFMLDSNGGAYITGVDLFFAAKSATLPVSVQIRPLSNGAPTTEILPLATSDLNASAVLVSTDGSVATNFVFKNPVAIEQGKQYAIVVVCDSADYVVYAASAGEKTYAGRTISKLPTVGNILKTVDGTTWVGDASQDLAFRVYQAQFNTGSSSTITFASGAATALQAIPFNGVTTTSGFTSCQVKIQSHGLAAGDTFTIMGAQAGNGLTATQLNAQQTVTAVVDIDNVTFAVSGSSATASGTIGGGQMAATRNYPFSNIFANLETATLPGTSIAWTYTYKQQANRQMTSGQTFNPDVSFSIPAEGVVIAAGDLLITATLTSNNPNISPVIDKTGMTALLIEKRVNYLPATPAFAYVTKPIKFDNPSTAARFYVQAKLPGSSQVQLFYKLIRTSSDVPANLTWTQLSPTKPIVNDATNFNTYEFDLAGAGSFIGYVIMVAGLSSDPCNAPTFKNFQSLALA